MVKRWWELTFGVIGNGDPGIIETDSSVTAPIPTFGLKGGFAFTDKWIGKMGFGFLSFDLALSTERQLKGEVFSGYASVQHNTFEHVYFALSYQYYDVKVDWNENGLHTSVGYEYKGPVISITV